MTATDRDALRQQLIRHEGIRLTPYRCTAGKLTIGAGRNLEDRGITEAEALYLLDNDIDACVRALVARFTWFPDLDAIRQRVMVDLAFNLGMGGLLGFRKFLAAMGRGDYLTAKKELESSAWYGQVGPRGPHLCSMLATGAEAA